MVAKKKKKYGASLCGCEVSSIQQYRNSRKIIRLCCCYCCCCCCCYVFYEYTERPKSDDLGHLILKSKVCGQILHNRAAFENPIFKSKNGMVSTFKMLSLLLLLL